jgi:hypothetical protein
MRESELADLKKEVEQLGKETTETLNDATRNVETHLGDVGRELDAAAAEVGKMPEASVIGQPGQTPAGLPHSPDDVTHVPPAEQGALADPGAIEPPPPAPILSERPMPPRESGTAELEPALGESGSNQTRSGA